jgi:hypothetical protein
VDLDNITAMFALKSPTIVKEVEGILGMVGYYENYVEGHAKIVLPLTEVLKKDTCWHWTTRQEEAFQE